MNRGTLQRWTREEERQFELLVRRHDRDFKLISELFPGRSYGQIRSHYYNVLRRESARSSSQNQTQAIAQVKEENPLECFYFVLFDDFE
ncbi:SANT/Myb_domain [Hexamita inflata]|uniref:SANT/Myb domain n=1 Tax=Hexamita inflata TaxID=28002 RepID=A0AA86QH69_9EUKA|nr:SANT/Myb domain [Hexamita inflata]